MNKWLKRGAYVVGALVLLRAARNRWLKPKGQLAGPIDYTIQMRDILYGAKRQVQAAKAGDALTDYRMAEDRSMFLYAPTRDAEAFAKGAYWLAVASRLTGDSKLASKASAYLTRAEATFALPGSSLMTGSVERIMKGAADALGGHGGHGGDHQVAAVLAVVKQLGSGGAVVGERAAQADRDVVTRTAEATVSDAGGMLYDASLWVRDALGLERPGGGKAPWWRTWLVRGGVALVALVGLRVAFAGEYHAAKAAVSSGLSTARQHLNRAKALLPAPTSEATPE